MTNVSPATGTNLLLVSAWGLPGLWALSRSITKRFCIYVRDGERLFRITRGVDGTAADSHSIGATVYGAAHVTFKDTGITSRKSPSDG